MIERLAFGAATLWRAATAALVAGALGLSACATQKGFNVVSAQEPLVKVGMTQQQVLDLLGTPTRNMHYRNQPGPTFTYRVLGSLPRMLFDVDFDAQGKVASTSERMDLESDRRFGGGLF